MADRSRADRAKLFAPFAALKGYYELILAQESLHEPRRELDDDEAAALNEKLLRAEKGDLVRVQYYNGSCYTAAEGRITRIDSDYRVMVVGGTRIWFRDILSLE